MTAPETIHTAQGRDIAFRQTRGGGPGIVFLGGFRSDMTGTKAVFLEGWARERGQAFLRFDYSGHGASSGAFTDGSIGDWVEDARAVLSLTDGPQILVGSSMGGWIALLLAREMPGRVAGLVGIAAAPDFTEDAMWAGFSEAQKADLMRGQVTLPSDYSDVPTVITRHLIEDGRTRLVLRSPLDLACPVRLLHGTRDADVPPATALRLLDHATGPDIRLTLVKGADHRFSTPGCLALIASAFADIGPTPT